MNIGQYLKRIIVLLFALFAWAYPIHAVGAYTAPQTQAETGFVNYEKIHEARAAQAEKQVKAEAEKQHAKPVAQKTPTKGIFQVVGGTDLKNAHNIDPVKLKEYLKGSPLAEYSEQLSQSQYTSLIIGICWIEQYSCKHAPYNNYWGMMKSGGGLQHFATLPDAITYMDGYFTKLYGKKTTVQSLRGYYCSSACTNWEPTVLRIKQQIENL